MTWKPLIPSPTSCLTPLRLTPSSSLGLWLSPEGLSSQPAISLSRRCQSEAELAGTPLVSTAGPMACLVGGSPFLLISASAE